VRTTPEAQLAGRTLGGRYDILELIGVGGMGTVYRARDRELDELVALKVIRKELASDEAIIERFRREVKLARKVTHANVARTFELGHADGMMFCTMELIDGESLTRRLRRQPRIAVGEAVAIARALCDALTAAHAVDVIHRDIKPDNVLIARGGRIVLADFGIASARVDGRSDLSGTPAYMAPEQARGEPPTPATDVYAVGVLLFEMLTQTQAFSGEVTNILTEKQELERLVIPPTTSVDRELADVIGDATARDVSLRIPTAAQLRARLVASVPRTSDVAFEPEVTNLPATTELRTVIIREATASTEGARLYLADAVRERLLRRLGRASGLRVLPRSDDAPEPGASIVTLSASDVLTIRVETQDGRTAVELQLPLVADQIDAIAKVATNAILDEVTLAAAPPSPAHEIEATDLLLRARFLGQRDVTHIAEAIELLERARVLTPDDPRVLANIAINQARRAFFATDLSAELLASSRAHVRVALAAGPRLAEAHLAAGHLELNVGEAAVAAGHYRVAIACAPHLAEAHESLGRMLLEAGFLDRALDRLEEALAIAPSLVGIRWDIARAYALEQRWAEHDQVMSKLAVRMFSGPLRLRFAIWRGDLAAVAEIQKEPGLNFDGILPTAASFAVYLDGAWPTHRDTFVARVVNSPPHARRRRSFVAQLVAEVAGFVGDVDTALSMISFAIDNGLFDLLWLDRCPPLAGVRASAAFPALRTRVQARADAILDALYGDHAILGSSDTVAASLP
jgi:serine/threonine-protein kinase